MPQEIVIGTRVRSFDFPGRVGAVRALTGERACYIEGEVVAIKHDPGLSRYCIRVDRDVFGGKDEDDRVGDIVYPPVNGTPTWGGKTTNYVEVV